MNVLIWTYASSRSTQEKRRCQLASSLKFFPCWCNGLEKTSGGLWFNLLISVLTKCYWTEEEHLSRKMCVRLCICVCALFCSFSVVLRNFSYWMTLPLAASAWFFFPSAWMSAKETRFCVNSYQNNPHPITVGTQFSYSAYAATVCSFIFLSPLWVLTIFQTTLMFQAHLFLTYLTFLYWLFISRFCFVLLPHFHPYCVHASFILSLFFPSDFHTLNLNVFSYVTIYQSGACICLQHW